MSRLPILAFWALVVATIAAFFVTQHLKVSTPLIAGTPAPLPAWINPLDGTTCLDPSASPPRKISYRSTTVSFYLLHRSDYVDVYIVDQNGTIVRTLASGRYMTGGKHPVRSYFTWDGKEADGTIAPDGKYYIRVALRRQGRALDISNLEGQPEPITVRTVAPRPVVTSVEPSLISPTRAALVTIRYKGSDNRVIVRIYRTDVHGGHLLVKSYPTRRSASPAFWNGKINRFPAPQGTYLIGLDVTDAACNTGHFPFVWPPPPGTTAHAGVTVRYLAAEPPLDSIAAGRRALVFVDSQRHPYQWALRRVGRRKPVARGAGRGAGNGVQLRVPLPAAAGLYQLAIHSYGHSTSIPLVAHAPAGAARKALVVLPALTWQGLNPVDDDGDGLPNTLEAGTSIQLNRVLVNGVPAGLADEAALLEYLDRSRLPYDLTTDISLIDGTGPELTGHAAVILAGSERWVPASLGSALRSYVQRDGHVLSLGIDSLRRSVTVQLSGSARGPTAFDPTPPASADVLGGHPGTLVTGNNGPIALITDHLGIFQGTSGLYPGFGSYQPLTAAHVLSSAGASATASSIIGFRLGRGTVVEVGLPGFGRSLAHNTNSQELLNRIWKVLVG